MFFNDRPNHYKENHFARPIEQLLKLFGPRTKSGNSIYVAQLTEQNGQLRATKRATPLTYEGMGRVEKNWTPFISENALYLIYSGQPHCILHPDLQTGFCQKIADTKIESIWKWGLIRGGTPAIELDGKLLTFFHSSQGFRENALEQGASKPTSEPSHLFYGSKPRRNYAMGAYLFENKHPFAIQKITPSPLGLEMDYTQNNRRKIIFPSGIVVDGNLAHVSWGKNDTQICISTFDLPKIQASMVSTRLQD